jgi:polyisoprenoid-binding protein YceI
MKRYRIAPADSRFTVQAFATGFLSFLGHSPTFAVRDYAGLLEFPGGTARGMHLGLTVRADSLELLDRVKPADREEIERTMWREVLEPAAFPQIAFEAAALEAEVVARGQNRLRLGGRLSLHGVSRPIEVEAELLVFEDGVCLRGHSPLLLSDFRIRPVTALGGTIKLKDELKVSFDVAAVPEGS